MEKEDHAFRSEAVTQWRTHQRRRCGMKTLSALFFTKAYPDAVPLDVPVKVTVDAEFPIPKSWSKKKKASANYASKKPDIDNIIKSVFDGLNGVAWSDDAMVSIVEARKRYTDQMPACYVTITTLEEKNE